MKKIMMIWLAFFSVQAFAANDGDWYEYGIYVDGILNTTTKVSYAKSNAADSLEQTSVVTLTNSNQNAPDPAIHYPKIADLNFFADALKTAFTKCGSIDEKTLTYLFKGVAVSSQSYTNDVLFGRVCQVVGTQNDGKEFTFVFDGAIASFLRQTLGSISVVLIDHCTYHCDSHP